MFNSIRKLAVLLVPVAAIGFVACDPDFDNNDARADGSGDGECGDVCDRYAACNDGFDAASCTDDCESEAATNDNFEADVEECRDCLTNADTCPGDAVVCFNECANVIASSN